MTSDSASRPKILPALRFNACVACAICSAWLILGRHAALDAMRVHWPIAVTMIFGSLIGGGTSEGGGAVAFPVFTKLLHIGPAIARNFALAIQSLGMGAASLTIVYLRIPIEYRVLLYSALGGIFGIILASSYVVPHLSPLLVRLIFSLLVGALGFALVLLNRPGRLDRNNLCPVFGLTEQILCLVTGMIGGILSASVGSGANTAAFLLMVLLFRISEKIATPTTVILMAIVSIAGFAWHALWMHDFQPITFQYWMAAIPVVVIGAPLGALLCSCMSRRAIVGLLLFLICLEITSTLVLVPMNLGTRVVAAVIFLAIAAALHQLSRSGRYLRADTGSTTAPALPRIVSAEDPFVEVPSFDRYRSR